MMAVETKKLKEQEMCNKTNTKYEHYNKIILKLQQRLKSEARKLPTKEINKIALSSNDDKKLQNLNKITYPYGAKVGKVCKTELFNVISCNI